jgi:hypothetical protein
MRTGEGWLAWTGWHGPEHRSNYRLMFTGERSP